MPTLQREHLAAAVRENILTAAQAERLWAFLAANARDVGPRFTFTNVLYYLGGMLAIGAMSLFMTLGFEGFGGWGIFGIALVYAGIAFGLAQWFESKGLDIPMGIMATLIVVLVPLAIWGLQHGLGWWADSASIRGYRDYHYLIDWRWVTLELATLLAGVVMLYRYRAPFLMMPVAVTLWYMSMDLVMLIIEPGGSSWSAGSWSGSVWQLRKWFSVVFGLLMLAGALWVDLRSRFSRDYAFWLYTFGLLTFWGGLTSMGSGLLAGKLIYLAINVLLVFSGAVLVRRSFTVFGAIGIALVLGDLSQRLFRDSILFPIALTVIGLAIVFCGVWWNRNEARIAANLRNILPVGMRELLAARRQAA